jgi:pyridoxamine 5'-phosphate oxidase
MSFPVETNDLDAVLSDIWQRLVRGKADRRSPFHTPIIASVDAQGCPQQRVMVLRKMDPVAGMMRFHTDVRSSKIDQLSANNAMSVIGYDTAAKVQIRVSGTGLIDTDGEAADAAWQASAPSSLRCYLAEAAPGSVSDTPTSGLPKSFEHRVPTLLETEAGRVNFATLTITLNHLEWLFLAHDGHRRAVFQRSDDGWSGQWLVP